MYVYEYFEKIRYACMQCVCTDSPLSGSLLNCLVCHESARIPQKLAIKCNERYEYQSNLGYVWICMLLNTAITTGDGIPDRQEVCILWLSISAVLASVPDGNKGHRTPFNTLHKEALMGKKWEEYQCLSFMSLILI